MENQEVKITPQDIIDKEFRVKFRGFDMAEVDSFLEEVAENLFRLTEENTELHEKILAMEQDLEAAGSMATHGREEFQEELGNALEDLRQDLAAINADLAALKQDRSYFNSLENSLKAAIVTMQRAVGDLKSQNRTADSSAPAETLEKLKQGSENIAAELAGLKEDRQVFAALKNELDQIITSAKETASLSPQQQMMSGNKALESLSRETDIIKTELAVLKQQISSISGIREDILQEFKEMLAAHFKVLEAKIVMAGERAGAPALKKEKLLTAEIVQQAEDEEEETALEDYWEEEDYDDAGLEFLSEDDILDVDKLRNVFQSVLDEETVDQSSDKPEEDDSAADLLFIDDDLLEDVPEPRVTFIVDEKDSGSS